MQHTELRKLTQLISSYFKPYFSSSWKVKSTVILSLLSGFYFTNSIISYFLQEKQNAFLVIILVVIIMEIAVRITAVNKNNILKHSSLIINNFRLGGTYGLVLEAFKLGS